MKRIAFITTATFLLLSATAYTIMAETQFSGSLKGVQITDAVGNNSPPKASFSYTPQGDTLLFDASGSFDLDGSIIEFRWDFGDGKTGSGATVSHQFGAGTFPVTLTTVDNLGGVAIEQQSVKFPLLSFEVNVNFQPANVAVPDGYSVDSGLAFDETRGYGWVSFPASDFGWRDRNNIISPDQAYDTGVFIGYNVVSQAVWELAVPQNGTYSVTVCMGDPTYGNDRQDAQVEDVSIITGEYLDPARRWIEKTSLVNVIDGRLTLKFLGSTAYARPCWIRVKSI
ncbi:PKD domain-containing protein [Desulfobulbus propionicus]